MAERHFISLGAGVQSSVMLLLADRGQILPRPEAAIFADTQWEPPEVYRHLEWLESEVLIPIHRVTVGDIRANSLKGISASGHRRQERRRIRFPAAIQSRVEGMGRRTCTTEYKIRPLDKQVRRLCGVGYREFFPKDLVAVQWLGITVDEASRMTRRLATGGRHSGTHCIDLGWNRHDCRGWFAEHYPGRTLPRSACDGVSVPIE